MVFAGDDESSEAARIYAGALEKMGAGGSGAPIPVLILDGTDTWHSTLIRWLTPATERQQQFTAEFGPGGCDVRFRYRNGKRLNTLIGIDSNGTFVEDDDGRRYRSDKGKRLYLLPLRRYVEWPVSLANSPLLAYVGTRQVAGNLYDVIFAATGIPGDPSVHDHYRIYINRTTGVVDYIAFTLRELMPSYSGALHYRDYRAVNGRQLPFYIGVADTVDDDAFVHEFRFESIRPGKLPADAQVFNSAAPGMSCLPPAFPRKDTAP